MSALKIYGTPASRTVRVLWMAKELGLEFESIPVDFKTGETDSADYKKINPNGRIPTLQDGDLTLCESMAINLYLAKKYPGPLTPKTVEDDGRAIQWTIWGVTEVEGHFVDLLHHRENVARAGARTKVSPQLAETKPQAALRNPRRRPVQSSLASGRRHYRRRYQCRWHPRPRATGQDRSVALPPISMSG